MRRNEKTGRESGRELKGGRVAKKVFLIVKLGPLWGRPA